MKKVKNNKGFTLVEVVIALALSAFLILGVTTIMNTSSRTYASLYNTVNLQYNSQIVATQLSERLVNCNGGIAWDSAQNTLSIVNLNDDGTKTLHAYTVSEDEILYGTVSTSAVSPDDITLTNFMNDTSNLSDIVSQNISQLSIDPSSTSGQIESVSLGIGFEKSTRVQAVYQVIALKNKPYYSDDLNDLLSTLNED